MVICIKIELPANFFKNLQKHKQNNDDVKKIKNSNFTHKIVLFGSTFTICRRPCVVKTVTEIILLCELYIYCAIQAETFYFQEFDLTLILLLILVLI
jgi:hypothetical protein